MSKEIRAFIKSGAIYKSVKRVRELMKCELYFNELSQTPHIYTTPLCTGKVAGTVLGYASSGFLCAHGFDRGWGSVFYVHGNCSIFLLKSCIGNNYSASGIPFLHATTELPNHMSTSLTIYHQMPVPCYNYRLAKCLLVNG